MSVKVATEIGAKDILADGIVGVALLNRLVEVRGGMHELAAEVNIAGLGANGVSANQRAFDDLVRVIFQQLAVLEGAGFRFIGVDDHVLWPVLLGDEAPLDAGRKACSTAAADIGGSDRIANLVWRHLAQGLLQPIIAAVLRVYGKLVNVLYVTMTQ